MTMKKITPFSQVPLHVRSFCTPGLSASGTRMLQVSQRQGLCQCGFLIEAKSDKSAARVCMAWTELWERHEDGYGKVYLRSRCLEHGGKYNADGRKILNDENN